MLTNVLYPDMASRGRNGQRKRTQADFSRISRILALPLHKLLPSPNLSVLVINKCTELISVRSTPQAYDERRTIAMHPAKFLRELLTVPATPPALV